jgi:hypothetical protein
MCREFAETVSELWRTIGQALDGYRPELCYMRGPGPKWRAKHSSMVSATALGPRSFARQVHPRRMGA